MTAYYSCVNSFFKSLVAVTLSSKLTRTSRMLLAALAVFTATSSFAASAILPPLPTSQPLPATNIEQAPITSPIDTSKPTPSEPAALTTAPQVPQEAGAPPAAQSNLITPPPTKEPDPVIKQSESDLEAKKQEGGSSSASNEQEHESFIDMGQKKLPRIGGGGDSQNPSSYNASDLRIPVIESEEKALKQNQQDSQASNNSPETKSETFNPAARVAPKETDATSNALSTTEAPSTTMPALSKQDAQAVTPAPDNSTTSTTPAKESQVALPETHTTPSSGAVSQENSAATQVENSPSLPLTSPQNSAAAPISASPQEITPSALERHDPVPNEARMGEVKSDALIIPVAPPPAPRAGVIASPAKEALSSMVKQENDNGNENKNNHSHSLSRPLTADHIKFIDDESIVFTLADDEVELGKLTEVARIKQMPGSEYIKLFWKSYENPRNEMRRRDVDLFLAMYETHPVQTYDGAMDQDEASNQAFDAASKGKLSDLRAIITYYPVLQMRDTYGNTMLGAAIESDNIDVAKFLLIRGIDLNATNYDGQDAFSIAKEENNEDAFDLLNKARFSRKK